MCPPDPNRPSVFLPTFCGDRCANCCFCGSALRWRGSFIAPTCQPGCWSPRRATPSLLSGDHLPHCCQVLMLKFVVASAGPPPSFLTSPLLLPQLHMALGVPKVALPLSALWVPCSFLRVNFLNSMSSAFLVNQMGSTLPLVP